MAELRLRGIYTYVSEAQRMKIEWLDDRVAEGIRRGDANFRELQSDIALIKAEMGISQ